MGFKHRDKNVKRTEMKENWIKTTDRLPDYSGKYLVAYTNNSQSITIAYFTDLDNAFWHIRTKNHFKAVTHWQPLIPPSK